ncbi:MAG TPA: TonB-dependent receptor [Ignavibacteria bacterium]|nr:TonB-dependent receptor [Ignavibacteria bacterium]
MRINNFYSLNKVTILFFILISVNLLFAGTTGKVKGHIYDKQTGEALIGVNLWLNGTSLGAATDAKGFYIILNISPGKYKLKASYIGYTTEIVEVQINVDLTTTQNFNLSAETIGIGEVKIVAAKIPVVKMDQTNTAANMNSEQIDKLPVQELKDLVQLQAGVVLDKGGGIHIRGGRSNEVAYLVDGVPISNEFSTQGGSLINIQSGNIQQLQVISGTFNAEYGQAQSGVINVITKEPAKFYSGSITTYAGDRLTNNNSVFVGLTTLRPSNEKNIEGFFSGPVPGINNLGFYVYGRYVSDAGYLFGKRLARPEDAWNISVYEEWFRRSFPKDPSVQNNIIAIPGSLLTGDGSIVAMNPRNRTFLNFKLNYAITPSIRLSYNFFFQNNTGKIYDDNYRFTPDALKNIESKSQIHILNFNHVINSKMFYDLSISYTSKRDRAFLFKNIIDPRLQTVSPTKNRFHLGGTKTGIDNIENDKLLAKVTLTWQIDDNNLLKIGSEIARYKVFKSSVTPEFSSDPFLGVNFFPATPNLSFADFLRLSRPAKLVTPQLTTTGETGFSDIQYEHNPLEFAIFVQNTLELNQLIINAGLRFDLFNPDHQALTNPRVIPAVGSVSLLSATTLEPVKVQTNISPRLGIAYPISTNGVVHVAYGHFYKTPPFAFIYDNSQYKVNGIQGPIVGNALLKPQKTVAYEIGLQQGIFESFSIDVTLFYSDFSNLIGLKVVRQIGNVNSYLQRTNIDKASNRGFTVAFEKLPDGGLFSGSIDYTFQSGSGSESDPNNIAIIQTAGGGGGVIKNARKGFVPLDWNQTHTLNATLAMNFDSWTISAIGRLRSGQPYSPIALRLNVQSTFKNSGNKPVKQNLDLFVRKGFNLGSTTGTLFLRIYNVFSQANELKVHPVTGTATRAHRFAVEKKLDKERLVGLFNLHDVDTHLDWFSEPRKIELGLTISF